MINKKKKEASHACFPRGDLTLMAWIFVPSVLSCVPPFISITYDPPLICLIQKNSSAAILEFMQLGLLSQKADVIKVLLHIPHIALRSCKQVQLLPDLKVPP